MVTISCDLCSVKLTDKNTLCSNAIKDEYLFRTDSGIIVSVEIMLNNNYHQNDLCVECGQRLIANLVLPLTGGQDG